MTKKAPLLQKISLKGLEIAPAQVWGSVRIVPLLNHHPRTDIGLVQRNYDAPLTVVEIDRDLQYISYVPHGLVLNWSDDGSPIATMGGQLGSTDKQFNCESLKVQSLHRMVKREGKNSLRLLPLHLAMEGFLSMFFNGPSIAWREYSKQAFASGLSPRFEQTISGREIAQLDDALRLFEIHDRQVGVLLFVGERLASAFIVPTPDDYRALHTSLLEDFYCETLYYHGLYSGSAIQLKTTIDENTVNNLTDLHQALVKMRQEWAAFQSFMAEDLLARSINAQRVYTAGAFTLQRFITDLSRSSHNYIGEAITDDRDRLQYLKIYGLTTSQSKRAYLLQQLASHGWNLERVANSQGDTLDELIFRMEKAGFGYLVNNQLREKAHKNRREQQKSR
jgi:hypothetical protein